MNLEKQPTAVTITFSPQDYWLKKSNDDWCGDYMLSHRIDMSYKGKYDQEGSPCLYLSEAQAKVFREAGFSELL